MSIAEELSQYTIRSLDGKPFPYTLTEKHKAFLEEIEGKKYEEVYIPEKSGFRTLLVLRAIHHALTDPSWADKCILIGQDFPPDGRPSSFTHFVTFAKEDTGGEFPATFINGASCDFHNNISKDKTISCAILFETQNYLDLEGLLEEIKSRDPLEIFVCNSDIKL